MSGAATGIINYDRTCARCRRVRYFSFDHSPVENLLCYNCEHQAKDAFWAHLASTNPFVAGAPRVSGDDPVKGRRQTVWEKLRTEQQRAKLYALSVDTDVADNKGESARSSSEPDSGSGSDSDSDLESMIKSACGAIPRRGLVKANDDPLDTSAPLRGVSMCANIFCDSKKNATRRCSSCNRVYYCNRKCERASADTHNKVCLYLKTKADNALSTDASVATAHAVPAKLCKSLPFSASYESAMAATALTPTPSVAGHVDVKVTPPSLCETATGVVNPTDVSEKTETPALKEGEAKAILAYEECRVMCAATDWSHEVAQFPASSIAGYDDLLKSAGKIKDDLANHLGWFRLPIEKQLDLMVYLYNKSKTPTVFDSEQEVRLRAVKTPDHVTGCLVRDDRMHTMTPSDIATIDRLCAGAITIFTGAITHNGKATLPPSVETVTDVVDPLSTDVPHKDTEMTPPVDAAEHDDEKKKKKLKTGSEKRARKKKKDAERKKHDAERERPAAVNSMRRGLAFGLEPRVFTLNPEAQRAWARGLDDIAKSTQDYFAAMRSPARHASFSGRNKRG